MNHAMIKARKEPDVPSCLSELADPADGMDAVGHGDQQDLQLGAFPKERKDAKNIDKLDSLWTKKVDSAATPYKSELYPKCPSYGKRNHRPYRFQE